MGAITRLRCRPHTVRREGQPIDEAIGGVLPLAIAVAISPIPIIAIVLMLGTPSARSTGLAFAVGWLAGLTIVGTVVLLVASGNSTDGDGSPATWTTIVKLVLGVLFVLMALKAWRSRPSPGQEAVMPRWMQAIDSFTAGKALGIGALLSAVNPKNLALTLAAATTIAATGIPPSEQAIALAIFVALGSLTIVAPVVIYFALGARATQILDGLKTWMADHNAAIMSVLLLVLGAKLIGDAISASSI